MLRSKTCGSMALIRYVFSWCEVMSSKANDPSTVRLACACRCPTPRFRM